MHSRHPVFRYKHTSKILLIQVELSLLYRKGRNIHTVYRILFSEMIHLDMMIMAVIMAVAHADKNTMLLQ